jgi:hypothetical protein
MDPSPFAAIIDAFNSDDSELRVQALSTCLAEDAEVSHIHGQNVGPAAFSNDIGQIREWLPGCTAKLGGVVHRRTVAAERVLRLPHNAHRGRRSLGPMGLR